MTYTYDDIITAKDILAGKVKPEDIVGKDGWFTDVTSNLKLAIDKDEMAILVSGTLDHIDDNDIIKFSSEGGSSWNYFIPKKEKPYEERQAEWIKENDIKVGDKVRIVRKARDNEGGWDNNWAPSMSDAVGKVGCVIEDPRASGIRVETDDCSFAYPYFVLEKVEDKPTYTEPEYIPFDLSKEEDRARLRGAWIRRKDYPGDEYQIVGISITNNLIFFDDSAQLVTDVLLERCEFVDGSPCGKLVEEE